MTTQQKHDAKALALALAAMSDPDGVLYDDLSAIIGRPREQIGKIAPRWVEAGLCVRVRWPRERSPSRLFLNQALADAFLAENGTPATSYASTALSMAREMAGQPLTSCLFLLRIGDAPAGTGAILSQLVTRGELFSCAVGRERAFFLTQAEADAFAERPDKWQHMRRWQGRSAPAPKEPKPRVRTGAPGAKMITPQRPSVVPGVIVKKAPAPKIVDYSRAVYNRDTTQRYAARYQALVLEPDPRWPSFASIPLGGTLSP